MFIKRIFCFCTSMMALMCLCAYGADNDWATVGTPRQLTFGDGNHLEASVAPDGRIAYESDANGGLQLFVLNPKTGESELIAGEAKNEMAGYPAWTPDGGIVYVWSAPTGTATEQIAAGDDIGTNLWLWKDGERTRLTKGLWRDFTPSLSPDGKYLWMTTSRGRRSVGDGSHLARLKLDDLSIEEFKDFGYGSNQAAVSPQVSPSGKLLVWAQLDSAFANWTLRAAEASKPRSGVRLNPLDMSCYAPRWSPDGKFIAFTGYKINDPGWGVWIMELRSGRMARLPLGAGNSKSPCWTPDGKSLVYENNASGSYKLYQVDVKLKPSENVVLKKFAGRQPPHLTAQFIANGGDGKAYWSADGVNAPMKATAPGSYAINGPKGIDFGANTFYVKTAFRMDKVAGDAKIVVAAYYPFWGAPAWQIYVDGAMRLRFSSRAPDGSYLDVCLTSAAIEPNRDYVVYGVHEPDGRMVLHIPGVASCFNQVEPCPPLRGATKLTIGSNFPGTIYGVECGTGAPEDLPHELTLAELIAVEEAK